MTDRAREARRAEAWSPEGPEAAALTELARSVEGRGDERAGEERFIAAFEEHVAAQQRGPAWRVKPRWYHGLAFAAVAAVAVVVWGGRFTADAPLSYRVGSSESRGGQLVQTQQSPVELTFSDGSVVTVEPSTTARVSETTHRGARFRLSSGKMGFKVVPSEGRGEWLVDAGPFQVRVTGTVFTVEWHEAERSLRVDVTRGHVVVEGSGQRRELGPGDTFHHRATQARGTAPSPTSETARSGVTESPTPRPAAAGDPDALVAPERRAAATPGWSELVANGEFTAVIEAADERGFDACLDSCSRDDLRALGDACRLGGRPRDAERVLLAQRRRFAGTADAAAAAFLMGRSVESHSGAKAIDWYDTYLREAPEGRFAGDALGRKMVLVARADRAQGRALAAEYLKRFPQGAYSRHGRSLIESAQVER